MSAYVLRCSLNHSSNQSIDHLFLPTSIEGCETSGYLKYVSRFSRWASSTQETWPYGSSVMVSETLAGSVQAREALGYIYTVKSLYVFLEMTPVGDNGRALMSE